MGFVQVENSNIMAMASTRNEKFSMRRNKRFLEIDFYMNNTLHQHKRMIFWVAAHGPMFHCIKLIKSFFDSCKD